MVNRSQPYRLKWPLTPTEVENIDDMLERLFKRVKALEDEEDTESSSSTGVVITTGTQGPPGMSGEDGEDGIGIPGAMGPPGPAMSRVVLTATVHTIADTYSEVYVDYFAIQGTGVLVLAGDAALAVI